MQNQDSEFEKAKKRLASNPGTSSEVLGKLADKDGVAHRVAENPATSSETLEKLAAHDVVKVRSSVAENENTSPDVLGSLAQDEHPDVRFRMAETARTPIDILEQLTKDENPYVSSRARDTLDRLKTEPALDEHVFQQPELKNSSWKLIVQLLERERRDLPAEIRHSGGETKEYLKARLHLLDETLSQLGVTI